MKVPTWYRDALGAAVLGALLFIGCCTPAHAQPYPRIGAYVAVRSSGFPLVRSDGTMDSAMCKALARYPKVVVDLNILLLQPNIVPTLVHFRPDIEVSGYQLITHWYLPESFIPRPDDKSLAAWWHLGIKGPPSGFIAGAPEGYVTNWGQAFTADTLTALAAWGVRRARVGGFFGDYMSPLVSWARVGNDFTDQARVANMLRLVSALRAAGGPGFRVYGNGTGADRLGLDGTMREGFPGALTSFTQAMTQRDGDWLKSEPGTSGGDPRVARFVTATACLTGATSSYTHQAPPNSTDPWPGAMWFPEYAVDPDGRHDPTGKYVGWLGQPYAPAVKLASGVYVRVFHHGLVLVNPTSQVVTLDLLYPRWKRINSDVPERAVTVAGMDALFLVDTRRR